ncbi:MAG: hypothetical protein HC915_21390 [Anaerolineae bacterium]|nr:hypothetical protein [Anaerolineae bacterium]
MPDLASTLAQVARTAPEFCAAVGPLEGDWFGAANLADPAHPALLANLERIRRAYPGA